MPSLDRSERIAVLHLGETENALDRAFVDELTACLQQLEADPPHGVVTTATGKHWSTGLDLDWMGAHQDDAAEFLADVERLLARLLVLPTATVAAIQGHSFAAGAMLALAHDVRIMREDRGYWCLPEVDLPLPFPPGMTALIRSKLDAVTAHEAMTTGRRYGGVEAAGCRVVDVAAPAESVLSTAIHRADVLGGKHPPTLGAIKAQIYAAVTAALRHE